METVSTLRKQNNSVGIIIGIILTIVLAIGGFFVTRALMNRNVAETQTGATDIAAEVNYVPGEIIISFKTPPTNNTDRQLQSLTQLFDLSIKEQLTDTTFLYESSTLRTNALNGIGVNNMVDGTWGNMDEGSNRVLTILNENGPQQISSFDFAEPNYKVGLFPQE